MTTTSEAVTTSSTAQQPGPALKVPAITTLVLFLLSLAVGLIAGSLYASPFADAGEIQRYFTEHPTVIRLVALLQFGSALALAVFTAGVWAKLRQHTATVTGPIAVAAIGGTIAATFLAFNSIVQWTLTQSVVTADQAIVRALNFVFFGFGGPGHVAALALLVAGVAVAGRRLNVLPKWLGIASWVIATLAGLSALTLITQAGTSFIPAGRFLTLIWLVVVAYVLPRGRRA